VSVAEVETKCGTVDVPTVYPPPVSYHTEIARPDSTNFIKQQARQLLGLHICGCRCNERLKSKTDGSECLTYRDWVVRGTGTPKDRDEVNRQEF
jgi:hypothetical protein